jgi:hypothetical protein
MGIPAPTAVAHDKNFTKRVVMLKTCNRHPRKMNSELLADQGKARTDKAV